MSYPIKGLEFRPRDVRQAFREKSSGTIVLAMREPGNPHDKHAIALYAALTLSGPTYEWTKIGYLPAASAKGEFKDLPENVILEGKKYGLDTVQFVGKTRRYV